MIYNETHNLGTVSFILVLTAKNIRLSLGIEKNNVSFTALNKSCNMSFNELH